MSLPIAIVTTTPDIIGNSTLGPSTSVSLDGTGSLPGTGGSSIVGYAWSIIDIPTGSLASISSATIGTPTLDTLDTFGNYLAFLVVTDDLGAVSQTDWRKAPTSAFALLHVIDDVNGTGLQLPAAGERNWFPADRDVTNYVIQLKLRIDGLVVQDLSDVASPTTTGPTLDILTDGSYATDTGAIGGVALHLHEGSTVDVATTSTLGVVELAEAPLDPGHPKAVTQDKIRWSAYVGESDQTAGIGTTFNKIGAGMMATANSSYAVVAFEDSEDLHLDRASVIFADAGSTAGGYTIEVHKLLYSDYVANAYTPLTRIATLTLAAPTTSHKPKQVGAVLNVDYDARYVVAFYVTAAPSAAADQGGRATFMVEARKKW